MILAIQFGLAIILFLFAILASWYEGSEILYSPSEWKYTALFSQLKGEIVQANDISPLDHFIYAIKFRPTFPILMFISGLYLLILIGYLFLKKHHRTFAYFLFLITIIILACIFIVSPSTVGAQIFQKMMIFSSLMLSIVAFYFYCFKKPKVVDQ